MAKPDFDPLIEQLSDLTKPVVEQVDSSDDKGLLVIGVKYIDTPGHEGVQTFTVASGFFGILAEGLYAELADQISAGNPELFMVLRRVIHDLEDEFDLVEEEIPSESSLH